MCVLGSLGAGDALRAVPTEVFHSTPPRLCQCQWRVKRGCLSARALARGAPPTPRTRTGLATLSRTQKTS